MKRVQVNFLYKDLGLIDAYVEEYGFISRNHLFQCVLRHAYINRDSFIRFCKKKMERDGYIYEDRYGAKIILDMTPKDMEIINFFLAVLGKRLKDRGSVAWERGRIYAYACHYLFGGKNE